MKPSDIIFQQSATLEQDLILLSQYGSSVLLNWGEDNNLWECSWITSGKRFTGFHKNSHQALYNCVAKAREYVSNLD